jgi:putative transposase
MSVDFKGAHYPKSVILYAVYFYVRYGVSYRDLEEIMEERGAEVDQATLNRWVVKFGPLMAVQAQSRKKPTAVSWRMDETYIKVVSSSYCLQAAMWVTGLFYPAVSSHVISSQML